RDSDGVRRRRTRCRDARRSGCRRGRRSRAQAAPRGPPGPAPPPERRLRSGARRAGARPAAGRGARTGTGGPGPHPPPSLALAAALVLGILLGAWLRPRGPLGLRNGELIADGALAQSLSRQLASNQAATAPVQIGVSFRSRGGAYCRTFVLNGTEALAGLACL